MVSAVDDLKITDEKQFLLDGFWPGANSDHFIDLRKTQEFDLQTRENPAQVSLDHLGVAHTEAAGVLVGSFCHILKKGSRFPVAVDVTVVRINAIRVLEDGFNVLVHLFSSIDFCIYQLIVV